MASVRDELAALVPESALSDFEAVLDELTGPTQHRLIAGLRSIAQSSFAAAASTATRLQPSASSAVTTTTTTTTTTNLDEPSPDILLTVPNVSALHPRGSIAVDFGLGFVEFRGKKMGRVRLAAKDVQSVQFLEKDTSSASAVSLLLIQRRSRADEEEGDEACCIVLALKGVNAKAAAAAVVVAQEEGGDAALWAQARNDKAQRSDLVAAWLAYSLHIAGGAIRVEPGAFASAVNPTKQQQQQQHYVSCHSRNVNEGKLFPLKSGLVFVGSGPFISMPREHCEVLGLSRSNSRTFELQVRQSGKKDLLLVFSSIHADEVPALQAYFRRVDFGGGGDKKKKGSNSNSDEEGEESGEEEEESGESGSEEEEEDSVYGSDSSSEDGEGEDEGEEVEPEVDETPRKRGRPRKTAPAEEEEEEEEEGSSSSSSSEDDEDGDDRLKAEYDDVAEMIEEVPYKIEADDVIPEGRKRQRKTLPPPEDLL